MRRHGLSQTLLMEESESRIEDMAREGSASQALVAEQSRPLRQVVALRNACFGLIHRKAMFEYLRQHKITGRDRYNNDDTLSTLVPYLKRQLGNLRRAILALPVEPEMSGLYSVAIRAPAANSQRAGVPFRAA